MAARTEVSLDVVLDHLKRARGFDFSGYKRSSLDRRVRRRMQAVGIEGYAEYLDHLELHPDEFAFLFNTILINVTGFYRDPPAWKYLEEDVLPRLLDAIPDEGTIRVWCAGCASGEEPYTVAMVLAEALGEKAYLERVKIYATDVDEEALGEARSAAYPARTVDPVPQQLLERYFDRVEQRYVFRKDLRRTVIFGRNDLVQDAPISRVDLLLCRNTLMYFNAETQSRILARLHFALNDRGFLMLGNSEMLVTHSERFRPLNLKRRVFQKVLRPTLRDRLLHMTGPEADAQVHGDSHETLRDGVFDAAPVAQVAVDAEGTLVMANRQARELFHLAATDLGRPLKDLELSYRPVELRANLERAYKERRALVLPAITTTVGVGDNRDLEVHLNPVMTGDLVSGANVSFHDVTGARRLQEELAASKHELENAYEELQSTVEELETTNEELQSTNEELETTNEELQSTNEELETMNEELQSTNEELETINDELRLRTLELNEVNAFLETILTSMGIGVVVVDRNQVVQIWNGHAVDLWGLRAEEVEGRHLLGLDIGLPTEQLKRPLVGVLTGRESRSQVVVPARNRRGREMSCRVTMMPLAVADGDVSGAILLMEQLGAAQPDGNGADGAHADGADGTARSAPF